MPGASASSRARRPPLQDEIRDGDIAEHCGSLERLAHAWLSLAADLPAFPAAGAEEEDDVPTAAAMGLRLQRAERALLVRLAAAFRVVICPQDLVVAAVKGGGSGEEDASSVEPIAVRFLWDRLWWMDRHPDFAGHKSSEQELTHACPSLCNRHANQVNEPALRHCLRAFLVVGRGDEAERQVARLVMLPFVDLNFTQVC